MRMMGCKDDDQQNHSTENEKSKFIANKSHWSDADAYYCFGFGFRFVPQVAQRVADWQILHAHVHARMNLRVGRVHGAHRRRGVLVQDLQHRRRSLSQPDGQLGGVTGQVQVRHLQRFAVLCWDGMTSKGDHLALTGDGDDIGGDGCKQKTNLRRKIIQCSRENQIQSKQTPAPMKPILSSSKLTLFYLCFVCY